MAPDGDHCVAELVRHFDHPGELGRVLYRAELRLVGLEIDGERQDGPVIEQPAGAEFLDLRQYRLGPEPLALHHFGLAQVLEEFIRLVVQAGGKQPHFLLRVPPAGGQFKRRFLERLEAVQVALFLEETHVARIAGEGAVEQQAVRLVGVRDDFLGVNLHRLVEQVDVALVPRAGIVRGALVHQLFRRLQIPGDKLPHQRPVGIVKIFSANINVGDRARQLRRGHQHVRALHRPLRPGADAVQVGAKAEHVRRHRKTGGDA